MTSLTLKDLPEDLFGQVRHQAELERRSMNKEFIHLVEQGLRQGMPVEGHDPEQSKRQVTLWRRLAGQWASDLSAEEEIASIYASRSPGREVDW
jgi:hypothetical protein